MSIRYAITGGCGFLGSNLAARLLELGADVTVFDSLYRVGSAENLAWLRGRGELRFVHGDVRNPNDVGRVFADRPPDVVFHLAGQVAMTTSLAEPRFDFEVNALGTLNVLEAIRASAPNAVLVYSSTNKVYGDLEGLRYTESDTRFLLPDFPDGLDESTPFDPHSPYGSSKGAADVYIRDDARMFGVRGTVFRHSSIYGGRQFATYDQGWIGWFCQKAVEAKRQSATQPFTISGTGKQVRDVLHADDAVECYLAAARHADRAAGHAFNIGGGMENSLSLLELFDRLERLVGARLVYDRLPERESDQKVFVANCGKAKQLLEWSPTVGVDVGLQRMVRWIEELLGS